MLSHNTFDFCVLCLKQIFKFFQLRLRKNYESDEQFLSGILEFFLLESNIRPSKFILVNRRFMYFFNLNN